MENYLREFDIILQDMISQMESSQVTCNLTKDFIRTMIPHHEAAIYMSLNLLNYNVNDKLKEIAKGIIKTQEQGIKRMQEIYKTTNISNNSYLEVMDYLRCYHDILIAMITKMENSLRCNNINLDFISEMIPHHEGAIRMCKNLLNYKIDKRLEILAKEIIQEQSQGIIELREIQKNQKC